MSPVSLRILFLTKREYMGHDLINDRFGRFREIPLELSRLGHSVAGVCLGYRSASHADHVVDEDEDASVEWRSVGLGKWIIPGLVAYIRGVRATVRDFRPDVVVCCSDAFHVVGGSILARRAGAAVVVDLYDNFESYRGAGLPGLLWAFRKAVRQADLVTCVSQPLLQLVKESYNRGDRTMLLENGVRSDLFFPGDRAEARRHLQLPYNGLLVGIAGAISRTRDVEVVFRAMDALADDGFPASLVVAGPRDPDLAWPDRAQVVDLGVLGHEEVPNLIRASDVMVVPNAESAFGAFSHPQKAIEAIACGVPVVAANTGAMTSLLAEAPFGLYDVGDPASLAAALKLAFASRTQTGVPNSRSWAEVALTMSNALVDIPKATR